MAGHGEMGVNSQVRFVWFINRNGQQNNGFTCDRIPSAFRIGIRIRRSLIHNTNALSHLQCLSAIDARRLSRLPTDFLLSIQLRSPSFIGTHLYEIQRTKLEWFVCRLQLTQVFCHQESFQLLKLSVPAI